MPMQTELKTINSFTREVSIKVPWTELESKYRQAFEKFRKQYTMPGFRPGRVPEAIVRKNYGPALEIDFSESATNEYYQLALDELDIDPINQATIKELHFHEGTDLEFTAQFEVKPEVSLPDYKKKFPIDVTRLQSTDNDLEKTLKDYQERLSTVKTIEDGAKTGHLIKGDFQELDESGVPVIGKKHEAKYIRLGEGAFTDEVEEALLGAKEGDAVRVRPVISDKQEFYEILIHKVEEQVLPELDDDFAKSLDPELETIEALREKIREQIDHQLAHDFDRTVESTISEYFVNHTPVDVPTSWKERYIDAMMEDMKKQQPANPDMDEAELRKAYGPEAEYSIKWHIIREAIIEAEKIAVTEDQLQAKIDELAAQNEASSKQIKVHYKSRKNRNQLQDEMSIKALFDHLKTYARIKETTKTTDALRKEQQG